MLFSLFFALLFLSFKQMGWWMLRRNLSVLLSVLFACLLSTACLFGVKQQDKKTTTKNEDTLLSHYPVKKGVLLTPQTVKLERFLAGRKICDGKKNDKSTLKLQIIALLSANYCMWSTVPFEDYSLECDFCRQQRFRGRAWGCQRAVNWTRLFSKHSLFFLWFSVRALICAQTYIDTHGDARCLTDRAWRLTRWC